MMMGRYTNGSNKNTRVGLHHSIKQADNKISGRMLRYDYFEGERDDTDGCQ